MNFNNYSTKSAITTSVKQTAGTTKRTIGKISTHVDHEDAFKSKIEIWTKWGRKLSDKPRSVNYGVPKISVDETVEDVVNLGRWGTKVEKEEKRLTTAVTRILECIPDLEVKNTVKSIITEAYTVSCRTELSEPDTFDGKKYQVDFEGIPVFYGDTDPYMDNNCDINMTALDIQSKLYNFVTEVFNRVGSLVESYGGFECYMFNAWGKPTVDGKQYLNEVTYPESLILPSQGKDGKLYYNVDNWDAQYIIQSTPHLTENEVGVIQGLIDNPTKYQEKFAINMKSQAEIQSELADTDDSENTDVKNEDIDPSIPF